MKHNVEFVNGIITPRKSIDFFVYNELESEVVNE